jgi:hypothetical protein
MSYWSSRMPIRSFQPIVLVAPVADIVTQAVIQVIALAHIVWHYAAKRQQTCQRVL